MSDDINIHVANVIKALHSNWMPHNAQAKVLHSIFYDGNKRIFVEAGRKFGKSELVCYILWRFASILSNANCYYFGPTIKQARELIWSNNRIKHFGPKHMLAGKPNDSEMRLRFKTGSFIKLDGSESYESYRGITPDIYVYDEYKDFHPQFDVGMDPNRAAKNAVAVYIGTPPEENAHPMDPTRNHPFFEKADSCLSDPKAAYFNFTSYDNPHISKTWLDEERELYRLRGDDEQFQREYLAKRIFGGLKSVFPMFDERKHIIPHHKLVEELAQINRRDRRRLEYITGFDPGTTSVFGGLHAAIDQTTSTLYLLDEIYADKQKDATTAQVIKKKRIQQEDLAPHLVESEWMQTYDTAAAWFANEALYSFGDSWIPCDKQNNKKEDGLSLIKDQMLRGHFKVSDRCSKLIWELKSYVKDKNGKIPKDRDHLIDCVRYINSLAGLSLEHRELPVIPPDRPESLGSGFDKYQDAEADSSFEFDVEG